MWQKTYNIDCERCNAPSPFVVAVHFHYCALKRAEIENSKNSILSYWCISCLSEIWKAYICVDTNFITSYPPHRASENSLSQITAVKCTVYRIPITQHAAREFLSPSMQNFTFHHWNSYRALKFNCIFISKRIFYIKAKRGARAPNKSCNSTVYILTNKFYQFIDLIF